MQADAAVFRTDKTLAEGVEKMTAIAGKMDDLSRSPTAALSGTAT